MTGAFKIPSSVQITTLLDSINLDSLNEVFNENLQKVDKWGSLDEFRCLDGGVLIALDGVWYHSSEKIRCPRCLHTTKGGVTTYYHSTLAGAIVRPGKTAVLDYGYSFIFTCKDTSHPWLAETITNSFLEETSRKEWNGRHHLIYTYQWLNGVQIRDNKETLPVNYLSTSIWNEEQKKRTFYNSWITNKTISTDTAAHLASCARARWKYRERTQQRT